MSQYALGLSLPAVYSEGNFYVSACNREAFEWIANSGKWPTFGLIVYGPAGSGKSHLGAIWAAKSNAKIYDAALPAPEVTGAMLIENADRVKDEKAFFHRLNLAREQGATLLLTSTLAPKQWPFTLPDLTSRLLALPSVAILPPDDEALAGSMRKQFADRQLKVSDEVISYLLPRIERSFAQAQALVEKLDGLSLAEKKSLTIPFLRKSLGY